MNQSFVKYIKNFTSLTLEDMKNALGLVKFKRVKPGEKLIEAGKLSYDQITVLKLSLIHI
mgnify:CR=1 FL=1